MNILDKVYNLTVDIKNIDTKYNSYAKFFDDDRETSVIKVKILNNNSPIDLENCSVEAYFVLANNTYHNETCKIINSSEGIVELQLCQKCLVKGKNIVRLSILKDNEIANTPIITYEVRKGLYSDNPNFNDDPLTPILSQMLLDIKVTKVNQIELQERYEKTLPKIEGKIEEVESLINRVDTAIASGTQDLEVKEARVDKNGKSYAKLGDRLDTVDSQLEQNATLISCKADKIWNINKGKFFAHRGAGYAPENTFASFELAKKMGFCGIETDIVFTKDTEPVLMHDITVDRTTDGTGSVSSFTLEQLKRLNIDTGANIADFPNQKIPTLDEFLSFCKSNNMSALLEIKAELDIDRTNRILDLILKHGMEEQIIIISFSVKSLKYFRVENPSICLGLVVNGDITNSDVINLKNEIKNNCAISPYYNALTSEGVKMAHLENMPVIAWNVNKIEEAKRSIIDLGVDFATTDFISEVIYNGTI